MGLVCKSETIFIKNKSNVLLCNTATLNIQMHTHACMFMLSFMCLFFEVAIREQKPHFIHSRSAGNTKHTHYTHTSAGLLDMRL